VREYYRGIRNSKITYMDFDNNDETLFIYSDRGTLHIYKINEENQQFFDFEYSKYRISLNYKNILCVFGKDNILYIINKDNSIIEQYEHIKKINI